MMNSALRNRLYGTYTINIPITNHHVNLSKETFMKFLIYSSETSTYISYCLLVSFEMSLSPGSQSQTTCAIQYHVTLVTLFLEIFDTT